MELKDSNQAHGIVRLAGEMIGERTYKDGRMHGLNREVHKDIVKVFFVREGVILGQFNFRKDFTETYREDPQNLLHDLSADLFRLDM